MSPTRPPDRSQDPSPQAAQPGPAAKTREPRLRNPLRLVLKILATAGFFYALYRWVDLADLRARLRDISPLPLAAASLLNLALLVLNAFKVHWLFPPPRPSFPGILRINMITVFLASFVPGGAAGELARWAYLGNACGSRNRALAAVLLDRITGLWSQVVLALVAWIAISRGTVGLRIAVPVAIAVLAAGIWACLWGYKGFVRIVRGLGAWYERRSARTAGAKGEGTGAAASGGGSEEHLDQALGNLLSDRTRFFKVGALSLLNQLLVACTFLLIDRSIGGHLSLAHALIFLLWYTLILVLPVTVGTWGLSEGTLGVLYHYVGSQSATGVLISLMLRVMNLPAIGLGLFCFLRGNRQEGARTDPKV
jgi:glycosyltransferase 2 family protein